MAKFKFHLEPVLLQRTAKENAAEQALALANNEYDKRRLLLENTKQRMEQVLSPGERKLDVFETMHLSFYRASLREKIISQKKDVSYAALTVERRRKETVQARQDRQVIEKLKDKRLQEYRREEELREQRIVDELALYTHLRLLK